MGQTKHRNNFHKSQTQRKMKCPGLCGGEGNTWALRSLMGKLPGRVGLWDGPEREETFLAGITEANEYEIWKKHKQNCSFALKKRIRKDRERTETDLVVRHWANIAGGSHSCAESCTSVCPQCWRKSGLLKRISTFLVDISFSFSNGYWVSRFWNIQGKSNSENPPHTGYLGRFAHYLQIMFIRYSSNLNRRWH